MFEVSVEQQFAAGHALRNYKGACENVHGHNFKVRVTLEGPSLDQAGMLVDFLDVKSSMQRVIERLDHRFLNDVAPFDTVNPSAENIAEYFHRQMSRDLAANPVEVRIREVCVWETDTQSATYRP
jgi:6-pyruvoyltetrahydropterin/6-carboxytetrahydropterin synthase